MARPKDLQLEGYPDFVQKPRTVWILMITGTLSILGSYLVIRELWRDRISSQSGAMATPTRSRIRAPIVRALLGLSIIDFLSSIGYALATVPMPRWQVANIYPYVMGSTQTCTAQGVLIQISLVGAPLYTFLVGFFYLAVLKYHWTDRHFCNVELWAHGSIWVVTLFCAIIPIPYQNYNATQHVCYLVSFPLGCDMGIFDPEIPCQRGPSNMFLNKFFSLIPAVPCLGALAVMMCMIFCAVRKAEVITATQSAGPTKSSVIQESSVASMNGLGQSNQQLVRPAEVAEPTIPEGRVNSEAVRHMQVNRRQSRAVAIQGGLFVLAFFLVRAISLHIMIFPKYREGMPPPYQLVLSSDVFLPIQGFFNALVLLRTNTLHTPEGRFLQKASHGCWSTLVGVLQKTHSLFLFCIPCRPRQSRPDQQQQDDDRAVASPHTSAPDENSMLAEDSATRNGQKSSSAQMLGAHESDIFNSSTLQAVSSVDPNGSIVEMESAALARLNTDQPKDTSSEWHSNTSVFLTRDSSLLKDQHLHNVSSVATDNDSIAVLERAAIAVLNSEKGSSTASSSDPESTETLGSWKPNMFNDSELKNLSSAAPDGSIAEMEMAAMAMLDSEKGSSAASPSSDQESSSILGSSEANMFNESELNNVSSAVTDDSIAERERAALAMLDEMGSPPPSMANVQSNVVSSITDISSRVPSSLPPVDSNTALESFEDNSE